MKLRSFGAQVIYGLIVGLVLGLVARNLGEGSWLAVGVDEVGSAYVSLLKLLVPPLVVTAVVTSIANLRQVTNASPGKPSSGSPLPRWHPFLPASLSA